MDKDNFSKLIDLILCKDLQKFHEEIFLLPTNEIFFLCKQFKKHFREEVRSVCDNRFWAAILLKETDKSIHEVQIFLKEKAKVVPGKRPSKTRDILDYYNENFSLESIWNDIKESISKKRQRLWNRLSFISLKINFDIKYILEESVISGDENATFAIILDNTSQKASIWNFDSNEFYCDHKHNLEDLKNWIEFEKNENDDICPNCCN